MTPTPEVMQMFNAITQEQEAALDRAVAERRFARVALDAKLITDLFAGGGKRTYSIEGFPAVYRVVGVHNLSPERWNCICLTIASPELAPVHESVVVPDLTQRIAMTTYWEEASHDPQP